MLSNASGAELCLKRGQSVARGEWLASVEIAALTDDAESPEPFDAIPQPPSSRAPPTQREADEAISRVHIPADLQPDKRSALTALLIKHAGVFASSKVRPANTPPVDIALKPGWRPSRATPARMSEAAKDLQREEIKRMADAGVIRPTTGQPDFVARLVVVRKKDMSARVCIDLRSLNANLELPPPVKLPAVDELLEMAARKRWFSLMDGASSYFQLELAP